ncbi:type VI secretion system baseplate subunit TssG [Pantoea agglomerans]|uniref:type VI secretion system baseplate subunit TssG n=1 Tax=Enterobacter agglomerans TaxID=549 RepID=UPI00301CEADB
MNSNDEKDKNINSFWKCFSSIPYDYDFFSTLRHIDAVYGSKQRLGYASSSSEEPVRLGQIPYMNFATSTINEVSAIEKSDKWSLKINNFGLLGPNGPLPLHLTEFAYNRLNNHGEENIALFFDIFIHRTALLFYRAWADAQPTVSLDKCDNRKFEEYLSCLIGSGPARFRKPGKVHDHVMYALAGHLSRSNRDAEGLLKILSYYFNVPVKLVENTYEWIKISKENHFRLFSNETKNPSCLSDFMGIATPDTYLSLRIIFGPLDKETYSLFLPNKLWVEQLIYLVQRYLGTEFCWDLMLVMKREDIEGTTLGKKQQLGLSCWLNSDTPEWDRDDLVYCPCKNDDFVQIKSIK